MSVHVVAPVWRYSEAKGTALLVLLALADNANDDGFAWPSLDTIAAKCRISKRQTIRVIDALAQSGELAVIRGGGRESSTGKGIPNHYRVEVPALQKKGAKMAPFGSEKGDIPGRGTVTSRAKKGDTAMSPEPSLEPSVGTVTHPQEALEVGNGKGVDEKLVSKFCRYLADLVATAQGKKTGQPYPKTWRLPAADLLLAYSQDELRESVAWGVEQPWWVNRIRTMPLLRQRYGEMRAEWVATRKKAARRPKSKDEERRERTKRRLDRVRAAKEA